MKKTKVWILEALAVALIFLVVLVFIPKYSYSPDDPSTWFDENNVIRESEINRLEKGMTYAEVIRCIGKANMDVGSGFGIYEYACTNGNFAYLWFQPDLERNALVLSSFRIETEPWGHQK